jgi:hypothetical protein
MKAVAPPVRFYGIEGDKGDLGEMLKGQFGGGA